MRVAIVSKALAVKEYQTKLAALATCGEIEITAIIPHRWGRQGEGVETSQCNVVRARVVFGGYPHVHFYPQIGSILREIHPAVIHIDEEYYVFVTYQVLKFAKKLNTKALFFTWQNIFKRYPFPFSAIERFNLKNADAAIAGNEEAKGVLQKKGFRKKIFVIPQFGVDEERFKKTAHSALQNELGLQDSFVVGYLGRLVPEKGIEDLLKAVASQQAGAMVLVVGEGPLRKYLPDLGRKLGLGERLKLLRHVPSTKVAEYLNCLDCLVLPSRTTPRWKEQFGRVLIEAMACEVPVIGSNSGEIPNVVADAGLIFKEGSAEDLAEKITMLRQDRDLRMMLAKAGRKRVLKRFTQKKIAEQTHEVYRWLAGEGAR